jgi:hypothetical protein
VSASTRSAAAVVLGVVATAAPISAEDQRHTLLSKALDQVQAHVLPWLSASVY